VLTRSLRDLEQNGLVERRAFAEVPVRVEYSLTDVGRTLCPIVDAMRRWADDHKDYVADARARYERAHPRPESSA
jgi:DNA-binding HxlR family transcriptional regulator